MADKIIILSGKQFCGKDTVAKILLEIFPDFQRIGLGDAIKLEYGEREGLSLEEIEKHKPLYRQDLIDLGNFRRSQDSDYWIKKVIALEGNIIVPDVRMKRELEFLKKQERSKSALNATGTTVQNAACSKAKTTGQKPSLMM